MTAAGHRRQVAPWHEEVGADVVVVGAGVAGLTAALHLTGRRVTVLAKTPAGRGGASVLAQGGVAAAVGPGDSPADHAADTRAAGGGLCDPRAVELLAAGGPEAIAWLVARGARFDRRPDGQFALGREGAHLRSRILHAADATGAEMVRALVASVHEAPHVAVVDDVVAEDLLVAGGRVRGVAAWRPDGRLVLYRASAVVLATGGIGHAFLRTTNPLEATGDGLAMAARAGAEMADLEFVQFHPTVLVAGTDPLPLLTEALRGEGARLVDGSGRRFMADLHPLAELGPRDLVARAIWRLQADGGEAFLDARDLGDRLAHRFPTVFAACAARGIDPRRDLLPVSPAAHYHMGGVAVDGRGATSLQGLWACGEVSSTGVHGANRLASNSLLEALVWGAGVGAAIAADATSAPTAGAVAAWVAGGGARLGDDELGGGATSADPRERARASGLDVADARDVARAVRRILWERVGLVRDEAGLREAARAVAALGGALPPGREHAEARNLARVAHLVTAAALARRESRGAHQRADHPRSRPRMAHRRRVVLPPGEWGALRSATGSERVGIHAEAVA